MSEHLPAIFKLSDDVEVAATQDNCGVAMFRDNPENDYLDIWFPLENSEEDQHYWIFNQREKLVWMGRICVQAEDQRLLQLAEREHGSFRSQTGWSPQVLVEDAPREYERELYARFLMSDLESTEGVPIDFLAD